MPRSIEVEKEVHFAVCSHGYIASFTKVTLDDAAMFCMPGIFDSRMLHNAPETVSRGWGSVANRKGPDMSHNFVESPVKPPLETT